MLSDEWCQKQLVKRWGNQTIQAQDCVFQLMRDAYCAGLKDAEKAVDVFLATDKYAAKQNIPSVIRALVRKGQKGGR